MLLEGKTRKLTCLGIPYLRLRWKAGFRLLAGNIFEKLFEGLILVMGFGKDCQTMLAGVGRGISITFSSFQSCPG